MKKIKNITLLILALTVTHHIQGRDPETLPANIPTDTMDNGQINAKAAMNNTKNTLWSATKKTVQKLFNKRGSAPITPMESSTQPKVKPQRPVTGPANPPKLPNSLRRPAPQPPISPEEPAYATIVDLQISGGPAKTEAPIEHSNSSHDYLFPTNAQHVNAPKSSTQDLLPLPNFTVEVSGAKDPIYAIPKPKDPVAPAEAPALPVKLSQQVLDVTKDIQSLVDNLLLDNEDAIIHQLTPDVINGLDSATIAKLYELHANKTLDLTALSSDALKAYNAKLTGNPFLSKIKPAVAPRPMKTTPYIIDTLNSDMDALHNPDNASAATQRITDGLNAHPELFATMDPKYLQYFKENSATFKLSKTSLTALDARIQDEADWKAVEEPLPVVTPKPYTSDTDLNNDLTQLSALIKTGNQSEISALQTQVEANLRATPNLSISQDEITLMNILSKSGHFDATLVNKYNQMVKSQKKLAKQIDQNLSSKTNPAPTAYTLTSLENDMAALRGTNKNDASAASQRITNGLNAHPELFKTIDSGYLQYFKDNSAAFKLSATSLTALDARIAKEQEHITQFPTDPTASSLSTTGKQKPPTKPKPTGLTLKPVGAADSSKLTDSSEA